MIKNRRRISKVPFIIGGVIVVATGILLYLNFNPIKPAPKEEYFPSGSLCEEAGKEFTYKQAGSLDLSYAFQTTAYKIGIPNAPYTQLESGAGAKINNTQYVYVGAYDSSTSALATVLNEVPLIMSESYNRNGSHAEVKVTATGYVNEYNAEYGFIILSADFIGSTKNYYAAYYSLMTNDESYNICICSVTEATSDTAKDLCVSWIDTMAASLSENKEYVEPQTVADIEEDEKPTSDNNNTPAPSIDDITEIDEIETVEDETEETENTSENTTDNGNSNGGNGNVGNNNSGGNNHNGGGNNNNTSSGNNNSSGNNVPHTHTYDNGVVTKYANCVSTGTKVYTCGCGVTYTETLPKTAHNYSGGSCTVCGAADPNQQAPTTPSTPTPSTPPASSYNGATDVDHNSFDSPWGGATMTVSVWTSAAADGCVCTMTCPDGSVVTASGGGTSFTFVVTSQEGTYTINITHASKIGSWGASINFGG